jgi:hypothetical protein
MLRAFRLTVGPPVTSQRRWRIRFKLWHILSVVAFLALYLALLRYEGFVIFQLFFLFIAIPLLFNPISILAFLRYRQLRREQEADAEPGGGIWWLTSTSDEAELSRGVRWLDDESRGPGADQVKGR